MAFKHSSAARSTTENVIVELTTSEGTVGYGEGCPRSYVTGETTDSAAEFLAATLPRLSEAVDSIDALKRWIDHNQDAIDDNPAAFCAAELAMLDALARADGVPIDRLLGLGHPTGPFRYSAVLGDNPLPVFAAQLARYRWSRLTDYKIKLSGDRARDRRKVGLLRRTGRLRLRVDANNHWDRPGPAIDHLRSLGVPLFGIEEPLTADDHQGFLEIAEALNAPIILDESLLRTEQLSALPGRADRWTLNCRVSKMGGLIRSLRVAADAATRGSGLVVGAQVGETSLLSRAALTLVAANRATVQAQEGAFGTYLLTTDITDRPIMFGRQGLLADADGLLARPGLGVDVIADRLELLR
jgi:L-alanine-DL-glutamate epimerase-like enolase superfamily enzyme